MICCVYLQNTAEEAEVRRLSQQAATLGHVVQALGLPPGHDPRRALAGIPQLLAEACQQTDGPWLLLNPGCLVRRRLDSLLAELVTHDVLVAADEQACWTHGLDPGCLAWRKSRAALDWLQNWAELSRHHACEHRAGIGATLVESLYAASAGLQWGYLSPALAATLGAAGSTVPVVRAPRVAWQPLPNGQMRPTQTDAKWVIVMPRQATRSDADLARGAAGTAEDFKEYAARHGITEIISVGVPLPDETPLALAAATLPAWQAVLDLCVDGVRLVLADYQGILVREPRAVVANLDVADAVVIAGQQPLELATTLVGIRVGEAIRQAFGSRLSMAYSQALAHHAPQTALGRALAVTLSNSPTLSVVRLPAASSVPAGPLGEQTIWWNAGRLIEPTSFRRPGLWCYEQPLWVAGHGDLPGGCAVA